MRTAGVLAMRIVNVHQAKTHLSQLLQQVEQGQDVVIARSGVPIARLVACTLQSFSSRCLMVPIHGH